MKRLLVLVVLLGVLTGCPPKWQRVVSVEKAAPAYHTFYSDYPDAQVIAVEAISPGDPVAYRIQFTTPESDARQVITINRNGRVTGNTDGSTRQGH